MMDTHRECALAFLAGMDPPLPPGRAVTMDDGVTIVWVPEGMDGKRESYRVLAIAQERGIAHALAHALYVIVTGEV